jgi:3-oxoacyl-[acyl-carrier-protein] synthase II
MVKYGMQDAMVCGGADEYDTTTVAVFDNLLACSTEYNDFPSKTPRPFDRDRDGLVVGEGAGALILEAYPSARARGAAILGEVIGFACNNNGGDLILPNKKGITETIRLALADAEITPATVDLISAHATGTKMGDVIEAQAIADGYGPDVPVVGLKSYMGHTMGCCGVIETQLVLQMMKKGFIAPTLNLENVDRRCAGIAHVQERKERQIQTAVIQNFAFGGVNTGLVVRPGHERFMQDPGTMKRLVLDTRATLVLWAYFTLGFILFYLPRYLAALLLAHDRQAAFQRLHHHFYRRFFRLMQRLIPGMTLSVAPRWPPCAPASS